LAGFGEALAHGAATIVNAIATGRGAAFGVDLWTTARVHLTRTPRLIKGTILSDPEEDPTLLREAIATVLRHFHVDDTFGAWAETESNIPIAKGLKSSSVASNALVLATVGALGRQVDDFTAVNLGVEASLTAKATITGAFDDACASFFGNIVVTDNTDRRVLHVAAIQEDLAVLLYAAALHLDPQPALDALEAGALASGLSGKGPAVVAVTQEKNINRIVKAWTAYDGEILRGHINRDKAKITRSEP